MNPMPVIVCDVCGTATPARFGARPHAGQPAVTEKERAADLTGQGWRLSKTRDLCPRCAPHEETT